MISCSNSSNNCLIPMMTIWAPHYLHVFTVFTDKIAATPEITGQNQFTLGVRDSQSRLYTHEVNNGDTKTRKEITSFLLLIWLYSYEITKHSYLSSQLPRWDLLRLREKCVLFFFSKAVSMSVILDYYKCLLRTYSTPPLPQRPARLNHPVQTSNLQRLASQP